MASRVRVNDVKSDVNVTFRKKSAPTKVKFSSTASSQDHLPTHGKTLDEVDQLKYQRSTQTKDGTSM